MDLDIGRVVRMRREELRLGKTELANMAGLSVQTISRIEKGHEFRYSTLSRIVDALRLRFDQYHHHLNETKEC